MKNDEWDEKYCYYERVRFNDFLGLSYSRYIRVSIYFLKAQFSQVSLAILHWCLISFSIALYSCDFQSLMLRLPFMSSRISRLLSIYPSSSFFEMTSPTGVAIDSSRHSQCAYFHLLRLDISIQISKAYFFSTLWSSCSSEYCNLALFLLSVNHFRLIPS